METTGWIPHSKPFFDRSDEKALCETLQRRYVTNGPAAEELGRRGAELLGKGWGIAVQSGTDALTACLYLLGIGPGSRVAIPDYICSAPLDALWLAGAEPVAVDVERERLAIDPERVNSLPGVDAVLGAHLFGIPASFETIQCRNLIEDCAQTVGISSRGRKAGSSGRLSFCSFYGTKLAASGHGGLMAGDDPAMRNAARDLFTHDGQPSWRPRFHFFMSDLAASLALSQLEKLERFVTMRRSLALRYTQALGGEGIRSECAYSRFVVETDDAAELISWFQREGIEAKRPVHRPIHMVLDLPAAAFPVSQWAHDHIVSVPLYPGMPEPHVERITAFLEEHADAMRCRPSG